MRNVFCYLSLLFIFACSSGSSTELSPAPVNPEDEKIPYYFIAIHCEPETNVSKLDVAYESLERMVEKADARGVKLTIMFGAGWGTYINESSSRISQVAQWKNSGHEIAAHHHGPYHGTGWDGFAAYVFDELVDIFDAQGVSFAEEDYQGDLSALMQEILLADEDIQSGCMNDEFDKNDLPDDIIYDTCSGYLNYGDALVTGDDSDSMKGYNEFVLTGTVNGIERKWLSHQNIESTNKEAQAEVDFSSVTSGAYGFVVHAKSAAEDPLDTFLDYLISIDADASKSRTLREVIDEGLLEEKDML